LTPARADYLVHPVAGASAPITEAQDWLQGNLQIPEIRSFDAATSRHQLRADTNISRHRRLVFTSNSVRYTDTPSKTQEAKHNKHQVTPEATTAGAAAPTGLPVEAQAVARSYKAATAAAAPAVVQDYVFKFAASMQPPADASYALIPTRAATGTMYIPKIPCRSQAKPSQAQRSQATQAPKRDTPEAAAEGAAALLACRWRPRRWKKAAKPQLLLLTMVSLTLHHLIQPQANASFALTLT
jgi:hypothetical protein